MEVRERERERLGGLAGVRKREGFSALFSANLCDWPRWEDSEWFEKYK